MAANASGTAAVTKAKQTLIAAEAASAAATTASKAATAALNTTVAANASGTAAVTKAKKALADAEIAQAVAQAEATTATATLNTATAATASVTAKVTTAFKALTTAMAANFVFAVTAVAVIALGAAYAYLSHELDTATKKQEAAEATAAAAGTEAQERHRLKTSITDAENLATGKVTAGELKLRDTLEKVTGSYGPLIAAQKAAIETARLNGEATAQLEENLKGLETQQANMAASATRILEEEKKAQKAKEAEEAAAKRRSKEEADARDKAAEADRASKKALEEYLDVLHAAEASKKAAADLLVEQTQNTEDLDEQIRKLSQTQREAIIAESHALQDRVTAQIEANKEIGLGYEGEAEQRLAIAADLEQKLREFDHAATEAAKAESEERTQSAKDSAEATVSAFMDIASSIGDIASEIGSRIQENLGETQDALAGIQESLSGLADEGVAKSKLMGEALVQAYLDGEVAAEELSDSQKAFIKSELEAKKKALKEKEAAEKKAAMVAFAVTKATAIAQAVVSTAQGVIASFQLGPIAGAIAAVAVAAIGATQIGLIASQKPSFAAGGFLNAAPTTGQSVTMHPNEAVLNQQGRKAIGDQAIINANNGTSGRGSIGNVTQIVYKHKPFEYFMRDNIAMNGTIAKNARKGDRVGQVRRGRG